MRRGDLAELAPWAWHCVECSARIVVKLRTGAQDGWALLHERATQHLRHVHHDFRAEQTFWESDWHQGGEPFDWIPVEDERVEWDEDECNELAASGTPLRELGRRYGVDPETIRRRLTPETVKARNEARLRKVQRECPPEVVREVKRLLERGASIRKLAQQFGISRQRVKRIRQGERLLPQGRPLNVAGRFAAQAALVFD